MYNQNQPSMSFVDNEPIRRRLPSASHPDSGSSMAMTPEELNAWKLKMGYGGRHSRRRKVHPKRGRATRHKGTGSRHYRRKRSAFSGGRPPGGTCRGQPTAEACRAANDGCSWYYGARSADGTYPNSYCYSERHHPPIPSSSYNI